jgi:hypothetical protein
LGVSRQGRSKTPQKMFLQKVHVENLSHKNRRNLDVSFFSTSSGFIASLGISQRWNSKTLDKAFINKPCRKAFPKKIDKKPETIFWSISFITFLVFGRFSVRGVQKQHTKYKKKNPTLAFFWPLPHPPTTGVTDFCKGRRRKKRKKTTFLLLFEIV